jgi:hypothetical protein
MPTHTARWLGVLACLVGIVFASLWAASTVSLTDHVALGVLLALAFLAILLLLLPLP